jgi:hypothetical protein
MQSSCDTLLDKVEVEGHVYTLLAGIFKDEEPAEVDGCSSPCDCYSCC